MKANKIIMKISYIIRLNNQVIYNKIEQCLIGIPRDFCHVEKHVRLINAKMWNNK